MRLEPWLCSAVLGVVCGVAAMPFAVPCRGDSGVVVIGPGATNAIRAEVAAPPPEASSPAESPALPVFSGPPVGSVVAWLKGQTNTPALPPDWVECNGQQLELPGSPYHGMTIPDLNGAGGEPSRFLRGSTQSGGTGGSERHRHHRFAVGREGTRNLLVSDWNAVAHLPPYYDVVWIMRVR